MINKYGKEINLPKTFDTKGEQLVELILKGLGVDYRKQFYFDETGLRRLKYDVAVFDKTGSVKLFIEYDGTEHYDPQFYEAMGTRKCRCKMHVVKSALGDARKMQVAMEKGIPILRIYDWQKPMLRDIIASYVYTSVDGREDISREISAVKMLDKYGWDFEYVKPSEPSRNELKFFEEREKCK